LGEEYERAYGVAVGTTTLHHLLQRLGYRRKKNILRPEQGQRCEPGQIRQLYQPDKDHPTGRLPVFGRNGQLPGRHLGLRPIPLRPARLRCQAHRAGRATQRGRGADRTGYRGGIPVPRDAHRQGVYRVCGNLSADPVSARQNPHHGQPPGAPRQERQAVFAEPPYSLPVYPTLLTGVQPH